MKKIYLAGPISGTTDYKHRFASANKSLTLQGHAVLDPTRGPDGLSYDEYMYIDLAMITICDAIYMLTGWEHSPGARRERNFATTLGKDVLYQ